MGCRWLKQLLFQVIKQKQVTYLPLGVKIKLGLTEGLAELGTIRVWEKLSHVKTQRFL